MLLKVYDLVKTESRDAFEAKQRIYDPFIHKWVPSYKVPVHLPDVFDKIYTVKDVNNLDDTFIVFGETEWWPMDLVYKIVGHTIRKPATKPKCDCGGAAVNEPHFDWCSVNQVSYEREEII